MRNTYDISTFVQVTTMQSIVEKLVEREKKFRKSKNLSQVSLAKRSGVSYASIRRFESTGEISLSSLLKIANALDCLEDFNQIFKTPIPNSLKDFDIYD